jgi:xanthine/uracil permease
MRRAIPIVIGVILLLLGIGWASQGAGVMGGSSLMDHNSTFIYLGGLVALAGIVLIGYGSISKPKVKTSATM